MENFDQLINTELFQVAVPEIYTPVIPKYFTQPAKGDLPRLNGVAVSWDEYHEARPEAVKDEEFIPDMIYNPSEMNMTISMKPLSAIIELLQSDSDLSIAKPEVVYPRMLDILAGYIDQMSPYIVNNEEIARYLPKVKSTYERIAKAYEIVKRRVNLKTIGVVENIPEFDKLVSKFL